MINKDQYDDIDYTNTLWGHPCCTSPNALNNKTWSPSWGWRERITRIRIPMGLSLNWEVIINPINEYQSVYLGLYRVLPQISRQSQVLPIPLLVLLVPILRCLTVKPRAAWRWRWRWPGKSFQLFDLSNSWNIMKHDERSWNMDMSWHIRWNSSKFFKYFNHVTTSWSLRISALCLIGFENAAECTSPWLLAHRHIGDWLWGRCEPIKNARNWVWRRYSGQSVWCSFCWNCFNPYKNILPKPSTAWPKITWTTGILVQFLQLPQFSQGPLDFQPRSPWIFWSLRCLQPPACTKRKGCRMVAFIADHLKPLLAVSCGKPISLPLKGMIFTIFTINKWWFLGWLMALGLPHEGQEQVKPICTER